VICDTVNLSERPQESSQLRFVGPSELPDHVYGFLHLLGILHCSLVKWFRHVNPLPYCWTLLNAFHPCLHMGQIIQCDTCRIAQISKLSSRVYQGISDAHTRDVATARQYIACQQRAGCM